MGFDSNTVPSYNGSMLSAPPNLPSTVSLWSIQEVTELINEWCEVNHVAPANGQAAEQLTERNVRYYRTRGLLDAPGVSGRNGPLGRRGFTEKHAAQLKAIRLLQARGLPLHHIEEQLRGRSLEELQTLERQELRKPGTPAGGSVNGHGLDSFGSLLAASVNGGNGSSLDAASTPATPPPARTGQENWLVSALCDDFLLVSRGGRTISDDQRRLMVALLRA